MNKIKIAIALAITGFFIIGCCSTINAVTGPIDLGTIDYQSSENILIDADHEVNLTFVSSEMNESDMNVSKILYNSTANQTEYLFESAEIYPFSTFTPSVKAYFYQDSASGQIYQINVDYTDVIPPTDPLLENYTNLSQQYDDLNTTFNNISQNYSESIDELQQILGDYENISGVNDSDLLDIAENLLYEYASDLEDLFEQLETISDELKEKENEYNELNDQNNVTCQQLNKTRWNLNNLTGKYETLNASYVEVENAWMKATTNASNLKRFFDDKTSSYKESFSFKDEIYTTDAGYEYQIKELQDTLKSIPIYVILIIIVMFLVCFIIVKHYTKRQESLLETEDQYGYSPTANKIDNFILGIKKLVKPKKETVADNPGNSSKHLPEFKPEKTEEDIRSEVDKMKSDLRAELTTVIHDEISDIIEKSIKKSQKAKA